MPWKGRFVRQISNAGVRWLSTAADDPLEQREQWMLCGERPAVLRLGRLFDVVSMDRVVGDRVFRKITVRNGIGCAGAVLHDRRSERFGFLVGPGTGHWLKVPAEPAASVFAVRYTGAGGVLLVPGPTPFEGFPVEWVKPPGAYGVDLTSVSTLTIVLRQEAAVLARALREEEVRA